MRTGSESVSCPATCRLGDPHLQPQRRSVKSPVFFLGSAVSAECTCALKPSELRGTCASKPSPLSRVQPVLTETTTFSFVALTCAAPECVIVCCCASLPANIVTCDDLGNFAAAGRTRPSRGIYNSGLSDSSYQPMVRNMRGTEERGSPHRVNVYWRNKSRSRTVAVVIDARLELQAEESKGEPPSKPYLSLLVLYFTCLYFL